MLAYVIRRLFVGVIMLIVMSLVTFVLFFASPIDPGRYACGKNCSPAQIKQTNKALGYDKPVIEQWTDFLKGVVQGRDYPDDPELRAAAPELVTHCPAPCFGYSVVNTETVNTLMKEAFPVSLSISLAALVHVAVLRRPVRHDSRGPKRHGHRPRDRRDLAGPLCLPALLHRALPVQVRGHQVAVGGGPRLHPDRRGRRRGVADVPAAARASPWPCSTWPATSG